MVKKGVLLDNGKTAQSSMALYWKNGRERQKNPKQKVQKEVDQEKELDERVQNGIQKWKIHKQKLITKAYTQKKQKQGKSESQKIAEQTNRQQEAFEKQMLEKYANKDRPVSIPGFKNKNFLKNHLSFEKIKQPDQSSNKLILPPTVGELSQQEIVRILREKKNKRDHQKLARAHHQQTEKEANQHLPDDFHALLGNDLKEQQEQLQRKEREEEQRKKKQEQNRRFFKSDLLNQIQKGDYSALIKKPEPVIEKPIQQIEIKREEKPEFHSKFIPRALKK